MYITTNKSYESIKSVEFINRNVLKYIVIILMLFDHLSYIFPLSSPTLLFVGMISRLTAPTMALSIAEGYHFTRDVKKYMKRLFLFSIISYIPYVMYRTESCIPILLSHGTTIPTYFRETGAIVSEPSVVLSSINSVLVVHETSVIFTLFLGLCTIYLWDKINISKYLKLAITLFIFWVAAFSNWHYYLILMCLIFYFLKNDLRKMWIAYSAVALLYIFSVQLFANPFHFAFTMNFELFKVGAFLVPLFFMFYNGKSGNKSAFNKWFFYVFYPGHLLLLGLIRLAI